MQECFKQKIISEILKRHSSNKQIHNDIALMPSLLTWNKFRICFGVFYIDFEHTFTIW